jgi:NADH dehydrogenase [ubiquinone] 1 alpha subcomplex assembly factor 7
VTALKSKIAALIRAQGPITIAQYMQIALGDPFHGYYISRDPFGRDFVTAPEVSQIFGELIGLFFVQAWEDRGRPERFHFVELGPGRGTLMADMMRAGAKVRPAFAKAAQITFVETSPLLRATQKRTLAPWLPNWVSRFGDVPDDAPLYLMANEFFDALPIRQFVRGPRGWHEQMVSLDGEDLRFALTPDTQPVPVLRSELLRDAPEGAVAELNPGALALIEEIGARITRSDGVALAIDYGHVDFGLGNTFQAMKANAFVDPLSEPGEADLTAHVDFGALKEAARRSGAEIAGAVTQAALLEGLGIAVRAARLKSAAGTRDTEIDAAVKRLIDHAEMGELFKAMALTRPGSSPPPGFPC